MAPAPVLLALAALTVGSRPVPQDDGGFQARADTLLEWVAEHYVPAGTSGALAIPQPVRGVPDPQKYIWPKVLARLRGNSRDAWARAAVGQFWTSGQAPSRHAASFYHFGAFGLARLLFAFPDAVAPYRDDLLRQAMHEEQLFSGEGTENHIAMWRTSGYLFAQEAGDARRMAEMRAWIGRYAERLYALGQGEWDSSTYASFQVSAWLNLFDYAHDPDVRRTARAVLDFYAAALALKYVDGALAGAEKRGFSGRSNQAISSFTAWLWFGDSSKPRDAAFFSSSAIYSVVPALSGYRPPSQVVALARKESWREPESYRLSKPNYAMSVPSQAREVLFATPRYSVGASVASPIGGWGGGDTQETLWKLVARGDVRSGGAYVIGGAGASYALPHRYNGEGRGPWDQVAQHEDVVIQMTRVPPDAARLTGEARALFDTWKRTGNAAKVSWANPSAEPWAYTTLPAAAAVREEAGVIFVDMGGSAYAAIRPLGGAYTWVREGVEAGRLVARTEGVPGEVVGFVYEFGDRDADGGFDAFRRTVLGRSRLDVDGPTVRYTNRAGRELRTRFGSAGTYTEPEYDWGPQPAWPAGEGHGRVPRVWVDGAEVDLTARWPIFDGPRLRLSGGKLRFCQPTSPAKKSGPRRIRNPNQCS